MRIILYIINIMIMQIIIKKIDNRMNYEQKIETTQMINQFLLNKYEN